MKNAILPLILEGSVSNRNILKKIQKKKKHPFVYEISLYGKATRIYLPNVSGIYGDSSDSSNDGIKIKMKAKDSDGNYTIDCGEVTTNAKDLGNSGNQSHGNFNGLGNGYFFTDTSYSEKNKIIEVKFYKIGNDNIETELTASINSFLNDPSKSYTVSLQ